MFGSFARSRTSRSWARICAWSRTSRSSRSRARSTSPISTVSTAASVGGRSGARESGGEPQVTSRGQASTHSARSSPRPPRTAPRPRGPGSSARPSWTPRRGPGWRCRASSATNTPAGHPINAPTTGIRKNPPPPRPRPATSTHPGRPAAVARRPLDPRRRHDAEDRDHPDHGHRPPAPRRPGARPRPRSPRPRRSAATRAGPARRRRSARPASPAPAGSRRRSPAHHDRSHGRRR